MTASRRHEIYIQLILAQGFDNYNTLTGGRYGEFFLIGEGIGRGVIRTQRAASV